MLRWRDVTEGFVPHWRPLGITTESTVNTYTYRVKRLVVNFPCH